MTIQDDENPFAQPQVAHDWIKMVEGERGEIRNTDIYPRLGEWVKSLSLGELLEIGCGQGICSRQLELGGGRYTGVDLSPQLVARARELYSGPNRNFQIGSAYELPFSDACFEATFAITVWHLLADLPKAASEMSRVLKRGGRFLLVAPNPQAYASWTEAYTETQIEGRRFEGKIELNDHSIVSEVLYLHTMEEISGALKQAGLDLQETETFRKMKEGAAPDRFISLQGRKFS